MGPNLMEAPNARSEIVPVADVMTAVPEGPAAILRGTARGLEVVVDATATVEAITSAMMSRLDEAPGFFRGSDVRIRVEDGPLPAGCLARLDEIASMFELRIVEVTAAKPGRAGTSSEAVPEPNLAAGSARSSARDDAPLAGAPEPSAPQAEIIEPATPATETSARLAATESSAHPSAPVTETSARTSAPIAEATAHTSAPIVEASVRPSAPAAAPVVEASAKTAVSQPTTAVAQAEQPTSGTRVVVGPVRSGVILEHFGHLIIFGDVNPGAEVRATGNIVVLGRLRGTAHAGIGQEVGFIMALRLEPQQLRIGRKVARAADSDKPASEPEIAYGTGDNVVVERYLGKLPRNLATSI